MKKAYPNGSEETLAEMPVMMLYIKAPNPFGTSWGMSIKQGIHNGEYTTQGVFRRGKKWILIFDKDKGWSWTMSTGEFGRSV